MKFIRMRKQLLLLSYFLFQVFSLQAQIHYFVEASSNMSLIPNSEKTISGIKNYILKVRNK